MVEIDRTPFSKGILIQGFSTILSISEEASFSASTGWTFSPYMLLGQLGITHSRPECHREDDTG